ncbi:hypothetical protein Agau_L100840 [Agrobacterium tumefaciens F2]|nr:hypothetical protein Agau_L100840 [Agrobacterium tumefaciens F2]
MGVYTRHIAMRKLMPHRNMTGVMTIGGILSRFLVFGYCEVRHVLKPMPRQQNQRPVIDLVTRLCSN